MGAVVIFTHTNYDWVRIDSIHDYLLFTGNMDKIVESELKTIIPLAIQGNDRQLTHNRSKTTYGSLFKSLFYMGGNSIIELTQKFDNLFDQTKKAQIETITGGGILNINSLGGWNTDPNFLDDREGEWIPDARYWEKFLDRFLVKGGHNTLIIENDTILSDNMFNALYGHVRKKLNFSMDDDGNKPSIIYGYNAIKELNETKAFIQELIATHGKLNILIETTDFTDEYAVAIKAFAPYIDTLYTNQEAVAKEKLGGAVNIDALFTR